MRLLKNLKNKINLSRARIKGAGILSVLGVFLVAIIFVFPATYEINGISSGVSLLNEYQEDSREMSVKVVHLATPTYVKAIYMTSWVAGTPKWRTRLKNLIEETELNAIVIDIKDYSGRLSFKTSNPHLIEIGVSENRIPDIKAFIVELHKSDIYVIGRITVFQDPFFAKLRPDLAVLKESDKTLWEDYKGLQYLDPGAQEVWDYIITIAEESYKVGFDELNFDYIRFPSDGNMRDIYFPFSEERIVSDTNYGKAKVIRDFFSYLHANLSEIEVVLSADLFGMTTTNVGDLNIGQVLEYAEPYFDYLAPMVYPSHYPSGFIGLQNPAINPYEVVRYSLDRGVEKLLAVGSEPAKLRPWLQDFDYKADYDAEMVRAQIQAVYDAGLTSWMLWDASNTYTRGALLDNNK